MMPSEYIRQLADEQTRKARRHGRKPVVLCGLSPEAILKSVKIPFLGDYVPKGWKRVHAREMLGVLSPVWPGRGFAGEGDEYLFVDSSGFGGTHEPAMTFDEFCELVSKHPGLGYATVEAGQFQVVVGVYTQTTPKGIL